MLTHPKPCKQDFSPLFLKRGAEEAQRPGGELKKYQ